MALEQPAAAIKLAMPRFTGDSDDTAIELRSFIIAYEAYAANSQMTLENQARVLGFCFQPVSSAAARWWTNILDGGTKVTATWQDCKTLLENRFAMGTTPSKIIAQLDSLKQGISEKVLPFSDRVESAGLELARQLPNPIGQLTDAQRRQAITAVTAIQCKLYFLQGLLPDIKAKVTALELNTFEDAVAAAVRVEAAMTDAKKKAAATIAEMEEGMEKLQHEVATLRSQVTRGRGRGRGGAAARGGRAATPQTANCAPTAKPNWIRNHMLSADTCYRCGMKNHAIRDCVVEEKNFKWPERVREIRQGKQNAENAEVEEQQGGQEEDDPVF